MAKNMQGSMVLMIAVSMAVLSALVDTILVNYDTGLRNFQSFYDKQRDFYMSEGVRSISTVLIEDYLQKQPTSTGDQIAAYLQGALPPLLPSQFTISAVVVKVLSMQPNSIIPNGAFAGMNGPVTELEIKFNVLLGSSVFGGSVVEPLDLHMSVAYISMFQFMMFFDVPTAMIQTGPDMHALGRVHSNGDFCVGGNGGTEYYQKVTVGGAFRTWDDSKCPSGYGPGYTQIWATGASTNYLSMNKTSDHGCTNCLSTGLNWDVFAKKRWNGQALDSAHGVQVLRLPGSGMGKTQTSNAGGYNTIANSTNLRFIVDPVIPSDTDLVKQYKYANQADIRIINGVWYLRQGSTWPGMPIWSDHPGNYVDTAVNTIQGVGQDDLRLKYGSSWPAAPDTPHAFSYYEYDSVNQTIRADASNTTGVISYGTLYHNTSATYPYRPGFWATSITGGKNPLCISTTDLPMHAGPVTCAGGCGFLDAFNPASITCPTPTVPTPIGQNPNQATLLLNATRSGFVNGHDVSSSPVSLGTTNQKNGRADVYPINFDIGQFQAALKNTGKGELGSYFGVAGLMGKPFNGIIYVDSQWPGSMNGYGGGTSPAEAPAHGMPNAASATVPARGLLDSNQIWPSTSTGEGEQALPQPLCSTSLKNNYFDNQGTLPSAVNRFRVPDCALYSTGTSSWPGVVRVVNGKTLDPTVLVNGLSFVTRLPVYLVGDYNTSSDVTTGSSTPWVSSLIAGDKVALVSNAWDDKTSNWNSRNGATRYATDTTYNTALLTDPSITVTLLMEDWTSRNININGSMVFGYVRTFANHDNWCCAPQSYEPPNRNFNFDNHFSLINNQPPGTPVFPVSATITWSK